MKHPAHSATQQAAANPRRWFRDLLWAAFPARSERDLAAQAAPVLDCSERQIVNYLREMHDPGLTITLKVLAIAGVELVASVIEGGR